MSCISRHRGVQLMLAYSWARPAILVTGEDIGYRVNVFIFFSFFTFTPVPLSSLSLSFISSTISSVSFLPFFWETTQNGPQGLTCRETPTQSMYLYIYVNPYPITLGTRCSTNLVYSRYLHIVL